MLRRSACLGLAVSAVLASSGQVRAGDSNDLSMNKPIYAADEARKPLMAMMDKVGMGSSMDSAGINVYGFVEGGWTYNFDTPNNQTNVGRVFASRLSTFGGCGCVRGVGVRSGSRGGRRGCGGGRRGVRRSRGRWVHLRSRR